MIDDRGHGRDVINMTLKIKGVNIYLFLPFPLNCQQAFIGSRRVDHLSGAQEPDLVPKPQKSDIWGGPGSINSVGLLVSFAELPGLTSDMYGISAGAAIICISPLAIAAVFIRLCSLLDDKGEISDTIAICCEFIAQISKVAPKL